MQDRRICVIVAEEDLTLVVILSVFSSILVSVIIVHVIWGIKGPYLSNWKSFRRNDSPIREKYTPQKAISQQHVSLDMNQRTNDTNCFSYDARPFQYFNHAMGVSTDDIPPQSHGKVAQRVASANTILFYNSSSYVHYTERHI